MSEWISVEDRLPEEKAMVLTVYKWSHQSRHHYGLRVYKDECWFNEYGQGCIAINCEVEPVTHWMPLPKPPEEEQ